MFVKLSPRLNKGFFPCGIRLSTSSVVSHLEWMTIFGFCGYCATLNSSSKIDYVLHSCLALEMESSYLLPRTTPVL